MILYPAIDIMGGYAVRLKRGDFNDVTTYDADPVAVAKSFIAQGAKWIHVIDLDGAQAGKPQNLGVVQAICGLGVPVQFGGGLRQFVDMEAAVRAGVSRMILGTRALTDPLFLAVASKRFAGMVFVGLDVMDQEVRSHGWQTGVQRKLKDLVFLLLHNGAEGLVITDISRDGMLSGPNLELYHQLAKQMQSEKISRPMIASGGISQRSDLIKLAANSALQGAVIGKALYEDKLNLSDALADMKKI